MAWYDEAIFYHIYPLGALDAPKINSYSEPTHRLPRLYEWVNHISALGFNALYIGPLFESVGHGYETTDYKKLDSRLGDNNDLKQFVNYCHENGIRVIFDGVFNHTGRDFFAFKDILQNRENSSYVNWYCNVNFCGNNEYNDGFSYDNWGGYNLLAKLNLKNEEVKNYICDVVRFWVNEFDVDGIRLDAADVLDFEFMGALRQVANEIKSDFWLMGEVIHGDYSRWANGNMLHSVTNYQLHKALYSGHNDRNYFEIAHTVNRFNDMNELKLYNFVDNHDVERIYTKLNSKAHFLPVNILLFTLPGIPSVYYGSEFAIEGKKMQGSDDSLRPFIDLQCILQNDDAKYYVNIIKLLCNAKKQSKSLCYGDYNQLLLTNRQYAFSRCCQNSASIICVNNDDSNYSFSLPCLNHERYIGAISGTVYNAENGVVTVNISANSGEILLSAEDMKKADIPYVKAEQSDEKPKSEPIEICEENVATNGDEPIKCENDDFNNAFEQGKIAGLQQAIISIMEKNGFVSEQMKNDVYANNHYDSLINWIKSFIR